MHTEIFPTRTFHHDEMAKKLVTFLEEYTPLAKDGLDLVLGLKDTARNTWSQAQVCIFGKEDLPKAIAAIQKYAEILLQHRPIGYVQAVLFFVEKQRLDAYIKNEGSEKPGSVDGRLVFLIESRRKRRPIPI